MIFKVELAQPNLKSYKIITIFMALLNAVSFSFYFLNAITVFLKIISVAGVIVSAALLYVLFKKMDAKKSNYKLVAFLLIFMALCWVLAANFYFFFLFLSLTLFSFIALKPLVISISDEGIKYPSFPAKFYNWQQVSQILIKDDVLSLDFSDNKFLQFLLPAATVSNLDVAEFNSFCERQIRSSSAIEK